jgi:hypothetical protein
MREHKASACVLLRQLESSSYARWKLVQAAESLDSFSTNTAFLILGCAFTNTGNNLRNSKERSYYQ